MLPVTLSYIDGKNVVPWGFPLTYSEMKSKCKRLTNDELEILLLHSATAYWSNTWAILHVRLAYIVLWHCESYEQKQVCFGLFIFSASESCLSLPHLHRVRYKLLSVMFQCVFEMGAVKIRTTDKSECFNSS